LKSLLKSYEIIFKINKNQSFLKSLKNKSFLKSLKINQFKKSFKINNIIRLGAVTSIHSFSHCIPFLKTNKTLLLLTTNLNHNDSSTALQQQQRRRRQIYSADGSTAATKRTHPSGHISRHPSH
jgi:hypothetical protein